MHPFLDLLFLLAGHLGARVPGLQACVVQECSQGPTLSTPRPAGGTVGSRPVRGEGRRL